MDFIKWVIGGTIGAAIGGAIWIAVGYYLEAEVGYIAWAIGLLAGIGVRVMADQDEGIMSGIAGIFSATMVILASKYVVVSMFVNSALADGFSNDVDSTDIIVSFADTIAEEQEAAGKKLAWPPGMTYEEATEKDDYPKDIWAQAEKQFNEMSAEEKQQLVDQRQEAMRQFSEVMGDSIKEAAFKDSFAPFDFLWFGLAAMTAFRVSSGASDD